MNIINNKYTLIDQIGSGAFGSIFKGENVRTKEKVAIKIESIKNETKLLKNESIIYQYLGNSQGIPTVKWFGKDSYNYYMVINLLGKSLEQLKLDKNKFSLKLTLQMGIQIIFLLKTIHEKGLIHRDVKPENFLLGLNSANKQIYIIDFGFCKSYLNKYQHIKFGKVNNLIGSYNYASVNSHKHFELSRRDDLESLGYMLIYFYIGKLDWKNSIQTLNNNEVISLKEGVQVNSKYPIVLLNYIKYVRSLEFEETPNYSIIIDSFKKEIDLLV
jgi:serine/threonine protein kinase